MLTVRYFGLTGPAGAAGAVAAAAAAFAAGAEAAFAAGAEAALAAAAAACVGSFSGVLQHPKRLPPLDFGFAGVLTWMIVMVKVGERDECPAG